MEAYDWLFWMTMLYLAVLVTALASGLITIARALMVTLKNLAQIEGGLAQVETQTKPLGASVQTINAALMGISGGLSVLLERLRHADASLGHVVDKLGARK